MGRHANWRGLDAVARMWADIWYDWNYADDETFGDIRNAAGQ
jgi:hypothetical protein